MFCGLGEEERTKIKKKKKEKKRNKPHRGQKLTDQWSSGYRASTTEAVDTGSIPGRVKPKTIKIGIHSFPA